MKQKLSPLALFQFISLSLLIIAIFFLRHECLQADSRHALCLADATRGVTFINEMFTALDFPRLLFEYYTFAFSGSLILITIVLSALAITRGITWWIALYFAAIACCVYAELVNIRGDAATFATLYGFGIVLVSGAFYLVRKRGAVVLSDAWLDSSSKKERIQWFEIVAFAAIMLATAATRFYGVNQIPGHWDSEMCGHRPVVASWNLMAQQELGRFSQTAAGLSWMLVHRFFTRYEDPLFFFLDQRILGAAISLLNCWLTYFFMRSLAGPFAGLMGLIVLAFGPLEIEWARGATLHHLPITIGLLMLWWSCKAFNERTIRAFSILALLIIASKYFYPSARLIALGPACAFLGVVLWHRKEFSKHQVRLLLIPAGLGIYLLSRSILWWFTTGSVDWLFPFVRIQPVLNNGDLTSAFVLVVKNIKNVVFEMFLTPTQFGHYTRHATIHPHRLLPTITTVFAGCALVRLIWTMKNPTTLIWLGVLCGGAIPALMTEVADRRIAFTVIAVSLLGILELSWFLNTIVKPRLPRLTNWLKATTVISSAVFLCTFQTYATFQRPAVRPHQLYLINSIRPLLTPGTLVVHLTNENPCPFFYGIYDLLQTAEGNIGYVYALSLPGGLTEAIMTPRVVPDSWQYRSTKLSEQVKSMRTKNDWSRVMYVFYNHPSTLPLQQMLHQRYPKGSAREIAMAQSNIKAGSVYVFETPWKP